MDAVSPNGVDEGSVLRITGLTAGYGAQPVLEKVSLAISLGEWVALLGPNGSGKSTLLYCVAGMLRANSGEIELCGCSLERDARTAKRSLGFGCAPERLPGLLTGRQCLEVYAAAKGIREIDRDVLELAEIFHLAPLMDRFVDTYSLGTRQKLAVLLALIGAPRLIVLDEAFNGLDPASARSLKRHLRTLVDSRRASILLATHALDLVERQADRAALMLSGRLVKVWSAEDLRAVRESEDGLEGAVASAAAASIPNSIAGAP
jgi:ABC-2 type transport system ATP-binding protein